MRKVLMLLMLLCSTWAMAQDVIVKTDGTSILCRVVEVNSSEIVYKKWSDLKGSNYVMNRKDVSTINYESGKKEDFSQLENKYSPHNQNTGYGQMNDNALAKMDAYMEYQKKAKNYKIIGWSGSGLLVSGIICCIIANTKYKTKHANGTRDVLNYVGGIGTGLGAICAVGGFWASNYYEKKLNSLQTTSLFQKQISFDDGSSLTLGVDYIRDNSLKDKAWGIGFQYNF